MLGSAAVYAYFSPVFLLHFFSAIGAERSGMVGIYEFFRGFSAFRTNKFYKRHYPYHLVTVYLYDRKLKYVNQKNRVFDEKESNFLCFKYYA